MSPLPSKRLLANQRNSKKSTGPRSNVGKTVVSRNALRHGLSQAVKFEGELPPKLESFARALAEGDDTKWEAACEAAVWRFNLDRVREAQRLFIAEKMAALAPTKSDAADLWSDQDLRAVAIAELAPRLRTMAGYARRYRSRFNSALRRVTADRASHR